MAQWLLEDNPSATSTSLIRSPILTPTDTHPNLHGIPRLLSTLCDPHSRIHSHISHELTLHAYPPASHSEWTSNMPPLPSVLYPHIQAQRTSATSVVKRPRSGIYVLALNSTR